MELGAEGDEAGGTNYTVLGVMIEYSEEELPEAMGPSQ